MPAHVVTLLIPVLFGLARGAHFGPLRFPVGGSVLLLSFMLAGGAFSVGYLTSISKFHRPQPDGLIVVMHPRSDAAENPSPHTMTVQQLVQNGYGSEVVVLHEPDSTVPPVAVDALKLSLPPDTPIHTASVATDADIAAVIADKRDLTCQFVGDRRDSARMRLVGQRVSGRVSFVVATTTPMGRTVSQDIEGLWRTWFSGFSRKSPGPMQSTVTMGSAN